MNWFDKFCVGCLGVVLLMVTSLVGYVFWIKFPESLYGIVFFLFCFCVTNGAFALGKHISIQG